MAKNVGSVSVDVVPDARGFREKLDAQLRALPTIEVKLDTSAASAKLLELRAELDTLHDKSIRVDDNGSAGTLAGKLRGVGDAADSAALVTVARMTLIGTAILAIIPLAAAASVAVAGIGLGFGIAALGAVVGKLALGGVGTAVKAGNNVGVGGNQAQQAAQFASAVNSQRQAEVNLAVAQREATQAQKDLTQARVDATQTLQDLSNQVTDNGLAQRQAVLDLQTAQRNLAVAKASPDAQNPANAGALAQVQLAFDQAKQNLTELQQKGSQLSAQQVTANALGVDGAANVVAAQNKVVDTQNALVQAQFQVADSARQVALAHEAQASGASAYQQAMDKLNPAQQKFALFLQAIKPQLDVLKNAAADSFLPLLQVAIVNLLPLIQPLARLLSIAGTAFGNLAVSASKALTGPFWTQFLTFVQNNLAPAISTFGSIFGGLFQVAAGFFQQAYPLIQSFGEAIAGALGSANGGVQGGALGGFFAFIKDNAPQLKETLLTIAGSIGSIFKSLAPSVGPALKAIAEIAVLLAGLFKIIGPVIKVLVPFAPLILAIVAAIKLWIIVQGAIDVLLDANPVGLVVIAVAALTVAIIELVRNWQAVVDFLGGPWGTAISLALVGILPFIAIPALIVGHWALVKGFFLSLWSDIEGIFTSSVDWVRTKLDEVVGFFAGLPARIASATVGMFDGIKDAFKAAINWVIEKWNALEFTIPGVDTHIPGVGSVGGFTLGTPDIPPLRGFGGPVDAGKPYIVGDRGLPELFIPKTPGNIIDGQTTSKLTGRGGSTFNLYALNPAEFAYTVERRLQFAGA